MCSRRDLLQRKYERLPSRTLRFIIGPARLVLGIGVLSSYLSSTQAMADFSEGVASRHDQRGCNAIVEAALFKVWKSLAGKVQAPSTPWLQTKAPAGLETVQVIASDGIELNGFKVRCCTGADSGPLGYVLFVQGNAMLASAVASDLTPLSRGGFDVFVFDFRGYGFSGGRANSSAIISDYREIVRSLDTRGYAKHFIYGISFGGAVILNAMSSVENYDAMIIDGTPSRLPFFCPGELDPERRLPMDCARLLLIAGENDRVVPAKQMRGMIDTAKQRGATIYESKTLCHPFMGCGDNERFKQIVEFFKKRATSEKTHGE